MKVFQDLLLTWPHISKQRRKQLAGLVGLMVIGSVAELFSIGAIVPFIAVLTGSSAITQHAAVIFILNFFGVPESEIAVFISVSFVVVVAFATVVRLTILWATNRVIFGVGLELGVAVFSKTINRPYSWHVGHNSSETLAGIHKVQLVVQGYLHPLMTAIVALVLATGMIIILVYVDPFVALAGAGAFGFCYFTMALSIRKRVVSNGKAISAANNTRIQELQEAIGNIRDIILDSSQKLYIDRFSKIDGKLRKAQSQNTFLANSPRLGIEGIGLIIIACFALMATQAGEINELLPVLGALGMGAQKLMPLIQSIYSGWNLTTANRPMLRDVLTLLDAPVESIKPESVVFNKLIELKNIKYCYPSTSDRSALNGLNLTINKGQVVGIVGKTGSGKSTLVDLIMGLLEPTDGKFLVDGMPLDDLRKIRGWSLGVAHVPQTIFLADSTIAQNIALGVPESEIDLERLELAARAAEIHDHIESLPNKYGTEVGERGIRLSGGQRQRLGIARALYRKSELLVLDEATSALDSATELQVISNIHNAYPYLTIIMVAHRISTLQRCDFIVNLENGKCDIKMSYSDLYTLMRV